MKTILSYFLDDTNPFDAPPSAFADFLDFAASEGIAGESSLIPAYDWSGHGRVQHPAVTSQEEYFSLLQRAPGCGIDTHFELFTHSGLYDFARGVMPSGAIHEGVWMYEPGISTAAYQDYFTHILDFGASVGANYTGITWPGCGCPACSTRYQQLREAGINEPNPNVWQALLNLAKAGRFPNQTVTAFFEVDEEAGPAARARLRARDGDYAVYTLPPNAGDQFGIWTNDPAEVNPDYYISAGGQTGRIVDLVRAQAPYAIFYCHWQGFNPGNGVGWEAFTQVIQRIQRHLKDEIEWMRPSAYIDKIFTGLKD